LLPFAPKAEDRLAQVGVQHAEITGGNATCDAKTVSRIGELLKTWTPGKPKTEYNKSLQIANRRAAAEEKKRAAALLTAVAEGTTTPAGRGGRGRGRGRGNVEPPNSEPPSGRGGGRGVGRGGGEPPGGLGTTPAGRGGRGRGRGNVEPTVVLSETTDPSEIKAALDVEKLCFRRRDWSLQADIADGAKLVVAKDGKVVGFAAVGASETGCAVLRKIGVQPSSQRKKIGSALLDKAIRIAHGAPIALSLWLMVRHMPTAQSRASVTRQDVRLAGRVHERSWLQTLREQEVRRDPSGGCLLWHEA